MRIFHAAALAVPVLALALAAPASAQIKIGVTVSATGPQASLGIPEKNTVALLPRDIAGQKVEYVVLDDASDTNQAVTNTRKLISEYHVDLIVGSTTTPNTLAMIDAAAEGQTPVITLASSSRLVEPMDAKRAWIFKTPHNDSHIASAALSHMAAHGVRKVAFIGFSNALGETFFNEISRFAELRKIQVVASERFAPNDSSVTAQILKITAAAPDAVVIGASGTPAALPARALAERGYKGLIYFNHGVSNSDFLRLCGKDCEGAYVPTGPVIVARQLPDSDPAKKQALDLVNRYESAYGKNSVALFSGYTWDVGLWLQAAVPAALKAGKPGSREFRAGLRDGLENIRALATTTGVVNTSRTDHVGLDQRSRVIARIHQGAWVLDTRD